MTDMIEALKELEKAANKNLQDIIKNEMGNLNGAQQQYFKTLLLKMQKGELTQSNFDVKLHFEKMQKLSGNDIAKK